VAGEGQIFVASPFSDWSAPLPRSSRKVEIPRPLSARRHQRRAFFHTSLRRAGTDAPGTPRARFNSDPKISLRHENIRVSWQCRTSDIAGALRQFVRMSAGRHRPSNNLRCRVFRGHATPPQLTPIATCSRAKCQTSDTLTRAPRRGCALGRGGQCHLW